MTKQEYQRLMHIHYDVVMLLNTQLDIIQNQILMNTLGTQGRRHTALVLSEVYRDWLDENPSDKKRQRSDIYKFVQEKYLRGACRNIF